MKYAIVTGASTGIGREVSLELAKNGFEMGLVGRNLDGLIESKKMIEDIGGMAKIYECDLSNFDEYFHINSFFHCFYTFLNFS